ncbi:putative kelch-type beta propeller [Helianthus annuus]|uniref:Kelch-type beta propeller n=2 Tax=Helianthus annuus TaxID=4232 RepID=A0A9K3EMH5_HELAN|nr:putative kelch-type beta propeller [Helianthus annuus]
MDSDNSNWHFELKYDRRVALPVAEPWPIAHYKHGVVVIDEKLYTVGGCRITEQGIMGVDYYKILRVDQNMFRASGVDL